MAISFGTCFSYQSLDFSFYLYLDLNKYKDCLKYKDNNHFFIPTISLPVAVENEDKYDNQIKEYGFNYENGKLFYTEPGVEICIENDIKQDFLLWLSQAKSSFNLGKASLKLYPNKITRYVDTVEFYSREYVQVGDSWNDISKYWLINDISKFTKQDKYIYQTQYEDSRTRIEVQDLNLYL